MKTSNWDAMIASVPINKDAAVARDGGGESWKPQVALTNCYENPPQMLPDFRGKRVGKLTGVFLAADPDREQHKWVFRCDCGRYAQFGSKAVYKQNGLGRAQCGECDYLSGIKNGTVSSPLERPALREVKALDRDARKALADKRDAVFHPMIDELIASLPDGYTRKDALNAMTTFVSAESAKLKLAAGGEQTQP